MSEEEYTRLLNQFPEKLHGALNWKIYFNRLVQTGRRTGRTDIKIGDDIRNSLTGQVDDRTIRLYLPPSMKHTEKKNLSLELKPKTKYADQDPHRTLNKSPDPPPPRIVEIQSEPQPEHPKKQAYRLNSKTCKGWPCERDYIYEIEVDEEKRNVTKMYAISD